MADTERRRLAVLGSPIAHSRSPVLHAAAYRVLELDWFYGAVDVPSGGMAPFLADLAPDWRGLSLTMPLKREVVPLLDAADELVRLTGVANTVRIGESGLSGFNTDVYGLEESFRRARADRLGEVLILGGGATAASALVAAQRLEADSVTVALRDPGKGADLVRLAEELELDLGIGGLDPLPRIRDRRYDTVISTLPNGAQVALDPSGVAGRETVLLDVAYEPWPTPLAASWEGTVIPGIEMLVHQAVAQVRVFLLGSPDRFLPGEDRVLTAMRTAAGLG